MDVYEFEKLMSGCIEQFEKDTKNYNCSNNIFNVIEYPVFLGNDSSYSDSVCYYNHIQVCIRDYFFNFVFKSLFEDSKTLKWSFFEKKVGYIHVRNSYSNDSFCLDNPIVFVIEENNERIGICYSYYPHDKVSLEEYNINKIEIIDFSNDVNRIARKNKNKIDSKHINHAFYSLKDFFIKHFSEEMFLIYISKIEKAIDNTRMQFGYNTTKNLASNHLLDFKMNVVNTFLTFDYKETLFELFDCKTGMPTGENGKSIPVSDYKILFNRFINFKLYESFASDEEFAKCFVSSEYLYFLCKNGHADFFDYSIIVTGYLKSVEILLKRIMDVALKYDSYKENWIKCKKTWKDQIKDKNNYRKNPNTNARQVKFVKNNEFNFSTEMAPMIWFLHDRHEGWFISDTTKTIIKDCLLNYCDGFRNEHLHKDTINFFEPICRIRENTIICIFYLLGGCKLTNSEKNDLIEFKIDCSVKYFRLYEALKRLRKSDCYFYLQFENEEMFKAIKLYNQDERIDSTGVLQSDIIFIKVDDFNDIDSVLNENYAVMNSDDIIIVNKNNLPMHIFMHHSKKGKI